VSAGPGSQLSPDARSNKQMHEDIMQLNAEITASGDSQQQNIAARLLEELSHLSQGRQQPLRKHLREVENQLKDMLGLPAISNKVIALIDAMEEWAAVVPSGESAARHPADRRDRVVGLTRALRQQQQISGLSTHTQLGRRIDRFTQEVQGECQRLKEGAAVEDLETLTWLPDYARVLGFHVAYRKILGARTAGQGVPGSATRSLALWPERAADCWDKHFDWARKTGLQEHFTEGWHPRFHTRPVATSRNE
jgi:hypothetical protein